MFSRLKASLSNPQLLFKYKDDRKRVVFLYSFILVLISMIPFLILEWTQGSYDSLMMMRMGDAIEMDIMSKDNEIIDGILISNETFATTVDFNILTNQQDVNSFLMVIYFGDTHLELKLGQETIESVAYREVLPDFDFNDASLGNVSHLLNVIQTFLNESTWVTVIMLGSILMSQILDYLVVTFLLVLLMQMNRTQSSLSFKEKYKVGLYMSTPYMLVNLILILFGLGSLTFISLFIGYVYYIWAYRLGGHREQV